MCDRCGDTIPAALVELYDTCDKGNRQPLELQLETTLTRILETFKNTYIIIDSLDECGEKSDLLRWIGSVASSHSANLHSMFTSRPEPEVKQGLSFLSDKRIVDISTQYNAGDIEAYLDAELAKMHKWSEPGEKEMIKDALLSGSDGMYVFLQFKSY